MSTSFILVMEFGHENFRRYGVIYVLTFVMETRVQRFKKALGSNVLISVLHCRGCYKNACWGQSIC